MGKHLRDKEKEINYLAQCLENAGKVPSIQFDFPNTDCHLAKLKYDFNIDQVACFGLNVTSDTSPYIQCLEHYLQTGETKQIDQQEWFNTDIAKQLRLKLVQFVEFAKVNVSKRAISYVVTNADIEATEQLPSLIMYSSNESMPFDPPGRPGKPEASSITAKSVKLKWTAPKIVAECSPTRLFVCLLKPPPKSFNPQQPLLPHCLFRILLLLSHIIVGSLLWVTVTALLQVRFVVLKR